MKILQVPDGLKRKALKLSDENGGAAIYCESCYGACDICESEAKSLGFESIVHFGHSKMVDSSVPVEYNEIRQDYDSSSVLEKDIGKIGEKKIGLVAAVQFLGSLEKAKVILEKSGKSVFIGKGKQNPGQIIGCDVSSAKAVENSVDAFLYIGSGRFHPLGLAIRTEKPVYVLDVEKGAVFEMKEMKDMFQKQSYAAKALARDAQKFGILVSVKPGQKNMPLALNIKKKLEAKGKKAYILVFNEIRSEKLMGLDLDCYVNTACPRITIEDRVSFGKPVLNPDELESFI